MILIIFFSLLLYFIVFVWNHFEVKKSNTFHLERMATIELDIEKQAKKKVDFLDMQPNYEKSMQIKLDIIKNQVLILHDIANQNQ